MSFPPLPPSSKHPPTHTHTPFLWDLSLPSLLQLLWDESEMLTFILQRLQLALTLLLCLQKKPQYLFFFNSFTVHFVWLAWVIKWNMLLSFRIFILKTNTGSGTPCTYIHIVVFSLLWHKHMFTNPEHTITSLHMLISFTCMCLGVWNQGLDDMG